MQASVPNPFPIPTSCQVTEENLSQGQLLDGDRKYMVRTLATFLMTFKTRPSLNDCGIVARALVQRFSFLADSEGTGEVCV